MRVFAASAGLRKHCSLMGLCAHSLAGASSCGAYGTGLTCRAWHILLVLGKPLAAEMEAFLEVSCAGGILLFLEALLQARTSSSSTPLSAFLTSPKKLPWLHDSGISVQQVSQGNFACGRGSHLEPLGMLCPLAGNRVPKAANPCVGQGLFPNSSPSERHRGTFTCRAVLMVQVFPCCSEHLDTAGCGSPSPRFRENTWVLLSLLISTSLTSS